VTVSGVTITGTGSGNYTPTQQTGLTADITAKALTITGLTASARVYDGTTVEPLGGTAALLGTRRREPVRPGRQALQCGLGIAGGRPRERLRTATSAPPRA